ncbi:hypothetical protein Tco_0453730 [Tanacetum coccineum]
MDLFSEEDDTTIPSLITKSSYPSPPNAPSKTLSIKDTSSTFGTTFSSFESKPQSSPPSSKDIPSPQLSNPFLDDIMDVPPRPSNLIPLQKELITHKEETDLETAQTNTTAKLPLLKQENENSLKPVARTTTNVDGTSTSLIPCPVTADEKTQKKNNMKARKDLNLNFLRNLSSEWNTHVVVWKNKPDLDTISSDDLYNNFNIVKQEVKGTANSSSSSSSQNMAFMSSPSSTNQVNTAYEVNTANLQVSPVSTQVSTASTQVSTANLSDATVYAFLANQPNGSQLVHEDLEQIHKDDLEEMDLKWQLALLSMRTRSYMEDDEVPTNMALMAFSDSEFNKSEFNLATYKRGLAFVEEQLVFYKKNEVLFYEQIAVLKRDISYNDSEISELKSEFKKLKQEKESNQLKIENFDNVSKSLDKLIGSQIPDKSRKGLGFVSYNVVPPPPTELFSPPTLDLSNSGLEDFQQPEFEGYGPKISKSVSENVFNEVRKSPDAPLVKELVSDVDKFEMKNVFPTKIEFVKQQEKPNGKSVKYAKMYRSQGPRGNQRNSNNQKSQQLGSDFVMYNKACFVCGSFDHL